MGTYRQVHVSKEARDIRFHGTGGMGSCELAWGAEN